MAVDPDEARLTLARKHYLRPNLMFIEANDTYFLEDQYSVVFSSYVLHWVENKAALLKRVYQNLKPGGQFGFIVPSLSENQTNMNWLSQPCQISKTVLLNSFQCFLQFNHLPTPQ